jgi:putative transposase
MPDKNSNDWIFRRNSLRLAPDCYTQWIHFVTVVTHKRVRRFSNPTFARKSIEILGAIREKRRFNLYSFCFMPDHFHALIGIGKSESNLGKICGEFKSLTTRAFWEEETGKLWQRQYFDHVIRDEADFWETVWYIRNNPVKARLTKDWESWEFYGEPDLEI